MQNIKKISIPLSIFLMLIVPVVSLAQGEPLGTCTLSPNTTTYRPPASEAECTAIGGSWNNNSTTAPNLGTTSTNTNTPNSPTSNSSSSSMPLGSLVPCDNSEANPCGFTQLMDMVNGVIRFVLFKMAVPIAAIMFFYAGFLMITAGGETASARTKAKDIFFNTALGLIIAVAAWLIIRTILAILGYEGAWIGF